MPMNEKLADGREYRDIISGIEARAASGYAPELRIVEGYATTFDQEYCLFDTGDYRLLESIDAHAFDECDMSDVIFQYNHEGRVFARNKNGTLTVAPDDVGLHIRADLSGTEIGRQLYDEICGGYTDKMSFGFRVSADEWTIEEDRENNKITEHRKITKIGKLFDVSACAVPANDNTAISARASLGDGLNRHADQMIEKHAAEMRRAALIGEILRMTEPEETDEH